MKRFYTIALAAAVALTATLSADAAVRRQISATRVPTTKAAAALKRGFVKSTEIALPAADVRRTPAPKGAEQSAIADMAGSWTWTYYSMLEGRGEGSEASTITITDEATGEATINLAGFFEVKATINTADATVTIPNKQYLWDDEDGPVYFYLKDWNTAGDDILDGASSAESCTGTISGTSIDFGSAVWAFGDPAQESLGWYELSYLNSLTLGAVDDGDDSDDEESIDTGNFTWSYIDYLTQGDDGYAAKGSAPIVITVTDEATGECEISGMFYEFLIKCYVNADDMTLSIPNKQLLMEDSEGDIYFYFKSWNSDFSAVNVGATDADYCVGTVDDEAGTVTFPDEELWAIGTPTEAGEQLGYYILTDTNVFTFVDDDDEGSISTIETSNAPAVIYDLQGRRVQNPTHGLYIINGRKVLK